MTRGSKGEKKEPKSSGNLSDSSVRPKTTKMATAIPVRTELSQFSDSEEEISDRAFLSVREITKMLKDIKKMFQKELKQALADVNKQIATIDKRTSELEEKTDSIIKSTKENKKEIIDLKERIKQLEDRAEEAESRSRRNNIRFKAVPETVKDLQSYAFSIFKRLLPEEPDSFFAIERIHRSLGRPKIKEQPRDIIARLFNSGARDKLLLAMRNSSIAIRQELGIQLFPDLPQSILQKRRLMKPVTLILQQEGIPYKWGFPFSIQFTYKQQFYRIKEVNEGLKILATRDTNIDMDTTVTTKRPQRDWSASPDSSMKKKKDASKTVD